MTASNSRLVSELGRLRYDFSLSGTERRLQIFETLERGHLPRANEIHALHESLCWALAFPESEAVRLTATRLLHAFADRKDLGQHRRELADSGIAGTTLYFRFYWLTAIWLVKQGHGSRLSIDWKDFENKDKLEGLWHLLLPFTETAGLDALAYGARKWIERLKGPDETDAEFVIRRFDALRVPVQHKEKLYEDLDIPMILAPGPGTPARTRDGWPTPVIYRRKPPEAGRPRLRQAISRTTLDIRSVGPEEGRRLIDLANTCMVPRHRDLLIFLNADENDVRMIDAGDGLRFACMGAIPERRLMFESVYGFLTLMNGVPIGYVLNSALYGSAEVAYNVFETYRGRGAAQVYAKILGMVHQLFGVDSFAVDPYQLGHGNKEGQLSGAWWFYYKLGFRPHDPEIKQLVRGELARMKRDRGYRTSPSGIHDLAAEYMYLHLGKPRQDVLGHLPLGDMGLKATGYLASRFGADREKGLRVCAREVSELLGLRGGLSRLSSGERLSWERWAPLVLALPGIERWSRTEKSDLAKILRAKGGRRESEFVLLFDQHRKLRNALLQAE